MRVIFKMQIVAALIVLLVLSFASMTFASLDAIQAARLMRKARRDIARQKWQNAERKLDRVLQEFAGNEWADDIVYWQGYIQEARGHDLVAFQKFGELLQEFPNSPFRDDATAHQIRIAQKMVLSGQPEYRKFILGFLNSPDNRLRDEAALSLGELGDSTGIGLVHSLAESKDLWVRKRARNALEITKTGPVLPEAGNPRTKQALLQFEIRAGKGPKPAKKKSWREDFLFFKTHRYQLYETLYKRFYEKDKVWSVAELMDYGLFHIVPLDAFEQYIALRDPYDKREWLRKFWKENDPTPTTEKNELKEEFERRVIQARAKYGDEWNFRHFRYLQNQYMRSGWSWSPWDSRGELLVKLGEPDIEDIVDLNVDVWYYSQYGVSFGINRYVTNIYHNGIYPNGGYALTYIGGPAGIEVDFIYNHRMFYDLFEDKQRLKGLKVEVLSMKSPGQGVAIRYQFPRKRLKMVFAGEQESHVDYLRRLVIFNQDYLEVYRKEDKLHLKFANQGQVKKMRQIRETIAVDLLPGKYLLALRIEDLQRKRIGILKKPFEVARP